MTFDVFGDFESRGYLRNTAGLKNPAAIKEFEHGAFLRNLEDALSHLKSAGYLTYDHVRDTHRILFREVYPWAGQDRWTTAPRIGISRGGRNDLFAHPADIRAAADYALKLGQDRRRMASHPGEVMGYLAHAHPFLDGNGRVIMIVHGELASRSGIAIDWKRADKASYLAALTRELDRPGTGELDDYLRPLVGPAKRFRREARMLADLPGLGPRSATTGEDSMATNHDRCRSASGKANKGRDNVDGGEGS